MRRLAALCLVLPALAAVAAPPADDAPPTGPLPRQAQPLHYDLRFRIDPQADEYSGTSAIHLRLSAPTRRLWLHGKRLSIDRLVLTDAQGKAHTAKASVADANVGVLRVDVDDTLPAQEIDLRFDFHAPFNAQLEGLYKSRHLGTPYIVSQMEPVSARLAFPGFDEPSFKAPFDLAIEVHGDDIAVANTPQTRVEPLEGGWRRLHFATTPALPTYLVALAVGPWDVVDGPTIPPTPWRKQPIPLRGLAAKGEGARLKAMLDETPQIVTALEDYFGYGYAFGKLDLLAAPDFSAGAMENPGLIVFRDFILLQDAHTPVRSRRFAFEVDAHELAHQWFGDTVTMKWWDDVWLNEGFASWMQGKITAQLRPDHRADIAAVERASGAMDADSLASARRVRQPIGDNGDIEGAFDSITYSKGASVLGMFEAYLGADKFRTGVRRYIAAHAFANATSDDLIDALAQASDQGARFERAMKSFLDRPGVPLLSTRLECGAHGAVLHLAQQRYLPLGSQAEAEKPWGLPVCVRSGRGDATQVRCELLDQAEGRMDLGADCPDWYFPNADGRGYYRVALAEADGRKLGAAILRLSDPEQLAYADAVKAAFDRGDAGPADLLRAMRQLSRAPTRQAATALFDSFRWIREQLTDAQTRPRLDAWAASLYRPRLDELGLERQAGESDERGLLRADLAHFLAVDVRDARVRRALLAQGDALLASAKDGRLDVSAVNADLLGSVLTVLVQERGAKAMDAIETALQHETAPDLRMSLAASLGSTLDAELGERARRYALAESTKIGEGARLLGVNRAQPENRAAYWAWFQAHYDALLARTTAYGRGKLPESVADGRCSAAAGKELEAFFAPRVAALTGGAQGLARARESVRLCAALRERQAARPWLTVLDEGG